MLDVTHVTSPASVRRIVDVPMFVEAPFSVYPHWAILVSFATNLTQHWVLAQIAVEYTWQFLIRHRCKLDCDGSNEYDTSKAWVMPDLAPGFSACSWSWERSLQPPSRMTLIMICRGCMENRLCISWPSRGPQRNTLRNASAPTIIMINHAYSWWTFAINYRNMFKTSIADKILRNRWYRSNIWNLLPATF
jgi:hypothetical protein